MGKGYPPEFRRRVLDLVASGRKVADVARDLGVSGQTIYNCRRQELIDKAEAPGLRSDELASPLVTAPASQHAPTAVLRLGADNVHGREKPTESSGCGEGPEQPSDAELVSNLALRVLNDEAFSAVSRLVPQLQKDAYSVKGEKIQLAQLDDDGANSVIYVVSLQLFLEHLGRNVAPKLTTQYQIREVCFAV